MTYAQLLDWLTTLSDADLKKAVQVLIADQVIPVSGIHHCGYQGSPALDSGHCTDVPRAAHDRPPR
jgi:hypothetical protein